MIVRDDVSYLFYFLNSSTPGHGPLDAHPVFFYSSKATLLATLPLTISWLMGMEHLRFGTVPVVQPQRLEQKNMAMEHGENMGMEIVGKTSTNGNVHGYVQLPEYHEL